VFAELSRIDRTKVARFIEALFRRAGTRLPAKAGHLAAAFMALIQGLTLRRAADPRSLGSNRRTRQPAPTRLAERKIFLIERATA
jgi:hypothetical protein